MAFTSGRSTAFFRPLALLLFVLTLASLGGCAGVNLENINFRKMFAKKPSPTANKTAEQLVDMGRANLKAGKFSEAAQDFKKLKEEYPYSKYATLAALKLADAYFGDEKYSQAAMTYSEFARLHPGNNNTPYVLYQAGMSHFLMFSEVDRNQDETVAAMKIFNTVIANYPDSKYAAMAKKQLFECTKRLTSHLFGVARQYYISGDYMAARSRLDTMKHKYPREIADLGYGHRVNQMLAECDKEIAKGPRKPSIWRRIGF